MHSHPLHDAISYVRFLGQKHQKQSNEEAFACAICIESVDMDLFVNCVSAFVIHPRRNAFQ